MTETNFKTKLQEDIKQALKARESKRVGALRLISAAVKQFEVDQRIAVDDQNIVSILDKMAKQRRDSITQYQSANRQDLVEQEQFELDIIQGYMPAQLSEAELTQIITEVMAETQAQSIKDMGKVMGALKPKLQGRADMAVVSNQLKQQFEKLG